MAKSFTADQLHGQIYQCTCRHEFQDRRYGRGLRLHTIKPSKGVNGTAVCTVCGKERPVP